MKVIVNNDYFIEASEIEVYRHKVRALVINEKGEIALTKYNGIYMLPGGKTEVGEQEKKSLAREIMEELGLDVTGDSLEAFLSIKNYLKDYPAHDSDRLHNRLTDTTYYLVETSNKPNPDLTSLSAGEKIHNFEVEWVPLKDVTKLIQNYKSDNPRKAVFDRDLLTVIAVYLDKKTSHQTPPEYIDLHTHSYFSDGELSPVALIAFAKSEGIKTISITDHDSVQAYEDLTDKFMIPGIKLIPGIEMTGKIDYGRLHILGYGIDHKNQELIDALNKLRTENLNKILTMIAELKKTFNITFTYEEIKTVVNANHNVGRPDLAKLLIQNGYVKTVEEAFDKYLIAVYDRVRAYTGELSYEECIKLIKDAGGIAVLAHPITLKRNDEDFITLLEGMIKAGLQGIEAYHPKHSPVDVDKYLKIANDYNLLVSGGSDYHGPLIKPETNLGQINNKARVRSVSILQSL